MSEPRFFPPQNALVEQILKEKYSPKIAPEFLYVWARRETEIISTTKEPNYIHLSPKERGESWFPITEEDFNKAWEIFDRYQDKDWSLTDCTSYVFMNRLEIKKAFAFDPHFDQFGSIFREPDL